jgi:hypothetical protein
MPQEPRLASALPILRSMSYHVGRWQVVAAAAIGAGTAWLLELPPALSAAIGVLLVPAVAAADVGGRSHRPRPVDAGAPARGLCACGHVMSMHCGSDSSGPCAVADCRCAGHGVVTFTQ